MSQCVNEYPITGEPVDGEEREGEVDGHLRFARLEDGFAAVGNVLHFLHQAGDVQGAVDSAATTVCRITHMSQERT